MVSSKTVRSSVQNEKARSLSFQERTQLEETEIRVYLVVSLIYEKVMDEAQSFEQGFYRWGQMLPQILEIFGLSEEYWEWMATIGDNNEEIQQRLEALRERYADYTLDDLLSDPAKIQF